MQTFYTSIKYCFSLFLITTTILLNAHNGSISGNITDQLTQRAVTGAVIILTDNNTSTITNSFGNYIFENLPKGDYALEITHIGYAPVYTTVQVNDVNTTIADFILVPAPVSLESVTISSTTSHAQNIVSGIDIQLRPVENAQDLLRLVPGLFIAQHAGGGKAEQIFLRGFDIDHGTDISVNVDGLPVNMVSHAHGQGYADLHFVIPETVKSFDFLKGPYQSTFSDFATAGSINFNTADAIDNNMVKISAGQFNTLRTLVMLQVPMNNAGNKQSSAYIAGEYQITDGPFNSPQDFSRTNLFGKYRTVINDNAILKFSASTFSSQWNASGQIPQRAVDNGLIDRFGAIDDTEGGTTSRSNLNLELVKSINARNIFSNQVYFTDYKFELYSNFTFFLEDSLNGDMIKQKEHRHLYGYRGTFTNDNYLFGKALTTTAGLGFRYDKVMENELSHVAERTILLDRLAYGNVYQTNAFAYVSAVMELSDKLRMQTDVRYDKFNFAYDNLMDSVYDFQSVDDGILTYKLNFDYTINKNAAFYLYSGKGFHSNDSRVVVAQLANQTLPAAYGADLGLRLKPTKNIIINPAVWVLYLEQEFVYVGDAAVVEAGGKTMRRGIDLSARWEVMDWLFLDADVNYTLAENVGAAEDEKMIPLAAKWTSIGGVNVITKSGFSGSFRYRYLGDRPANEMGSVIAEGYFVNDVVMLYQIKQFDLGLEIQNLFNVEWNEAQFDTESRLQSEPTPVSELHFTPGTPFFVKGSIGVRF
jgi:hypothetical protein